MSHRKQCCVFSALSIFRVCQSKIPFRKAITAVHNPSIAVLINNHNNGSYIAECIESVLSQTEPPEEIIIVDDGSTDNSREIIGALAARHSCIKTIYTENRGQTAAIGSGVSASRQEIVTLLDGDDSYQPGHLAAMRRRWSEFPQADLIYCRFSMTGDSDLIGAFKRSLSAMDFKGLLGPIDWEKPYDWGYCTALVYFLPDLFLGNNTSTLSLRAHHAKRLELEEFARTARPFVRAFADKVVLMSSALGGGRRVYVPERTVSYRLRKGSAAAHLAAEFTSPSRYQILKERYAIEDWLLHRVPRSPSRMRKLLELELSTAPCPSPGHAALYRKAKKIARHQMSFVERLNSALSRGLRDLRVFLYRKGMDTFGKR
jgi:glycosyltransferase involved in cell wall biosynthesis